MKFALISYCLVFLSFFMRVETSLSQKNAIEETIWVDSVLNVLKMDTRSDIRRRSDMADSVFWISQSLNDVCRQVRARIYQSAYLDFIGMPDSALTQLYWVKGAIRKDCDSLLLVLMYSGLSSCYLSLGELLRVDSTSRMALALWNPAWKENSSRFVILNNLAIAQVMLGDTLSGTGTFRQVYREALAVNDTENYRKALINLGAIKGMSHELDSAYYFFHAVLSPSLEEEDIVAYMDVQYNLANIDIDRRNYKEASLRLDSLFALAKRRESLDVQATALDARSKIFFNQGNFRTAYEYLRNYIDLHDQSLNEDRIKAVTEMMEKYESEKKARHIQQLEVKNLDASLTNERIKNARNRLMFGGAGILLMALGLWNRLLHVRKSRAAVQHEKDVSEGLLLNILPASVADELKLKGNAEARLYPSSTILFSDFKGFTEISGELSATDLVDELNVCFKEFDIIITRHGLEKIKTIGDAYMAAASIPDNNKSTALDSIYAALDMQLFITSRKKEREAQQLPAFEMRLGLHSGPVVAGIVGLKKFQYDLWGDTVNIASRMETNGEAGRVNISEATFDLVQSVPSLHFIPRGNIQVKGKGEMMMYFVETRS